MGRERLERDPPAAPAGLRRSRATRGPVRPDVRDARAHRGGWTAWLYTCRSSHRGDHGGRHGPQAPRGAPGGRDGVLPEQPDRQRAGPAHHRGRRARVGRAVHRGRGVHRIRRADDGRPGEPLPERGRRADVLEGVRARRARIGCLASPEVVEDLRRVRLLPPERADAGGGARGAAPPRRGARDPGRGPGAARRILGELPRLGVEAFPSDANFVLFRPPGDGAAVWRALLDRGVLVRDFTSVIPDALRVTAGTPEEVDLFLSALEEALR